MTSRVPRRSAFTLVELLVVIGIIALLISILLPSLNRARRAAQTIACASNQKQIIVAMLMYANDFKQFLPGPCIQSINDPRLWNSNTNDPKVFTQIDTWYGDQTYHVKNLASNDLLQRYVGGRGNYKIWMCPGNTQMWEQAAPVSGKLAGKTVGYGYLLNNNNQVENSYPAYLFGAYTASATAEQAAPKKITSILYPIRDTAGTLKSRVREPTKVWIMSDLDGRNFADNVSGVLGIAAAVNVNNDTQDQKNLRPWQPVHRNGSAMPGGLGRNYGYLDTHVEWKGFGDWPAAPVAN